MNINEAKNVIASKADEEQIFRFVQAAAMLADKVNDDNVAFTELVDCLKLGQKRQELRLVGEYAALALYRRTGRVRRDALPYRDLIVDPTNWTEYLKEREFI